jgi:SAM-dependent methyltransferase
MRKTHSLDAAYFEGLYQANPDPWRFESSDYEARKYARTLDVVAESPVARGLELGCSIGVLTLQLASKCERLVATELSRIALDQARRRCAGRDNIDFVLAERVTDGIDGAFDLMLLSEVVYYWDDRDLSAVAAAIAEHLQPGGRLILVHWLGETDYPRSADDAVGSLQALVGEGFEVEAESRDDDYRLDVWRRRPA